MDATLLSLLPTYTAGALPNALSSLATALLAQSRSKASALKPDEEVARAYTCCHIACERLKQRLNLPRIEPRPPCGSKVYKKLYAYLDGVLTAKAPVTSTALASNPSTPTKNVRISEQRGSVPQPRKIPLSRKRPTSLVPGTVQVAKTAQEDVPAWLTSTLRHLCRTLGASKAYPHVYTGVLSVSRTSLSEELPNSAQSKAHESSNIFHMVAGEHDWAALSVAVLLIVLANLPDAPDPSEQIGPAVDELIALKVIDASHTEYIISSVERFLEYEGPIWENMDWFKSTARFGLLEEDEAAEHNPSDQQTPADLGVRTTQSEVLETFNRNGSLQCGLGTMMQDKVDWLSDERQEHFHRWQAYMLLRIEQTEQGRLSKVAGATI